MIQSLVGRCHVFSWFEYLSSDASQQVTAQGTKVLTKSLMAMLAPSGLPTEVQEYLSRSRSVIFLVLKKYVRVLFGFWVNSACPKQAWTTHCRKRKQRVLKTTIERGLTQGQQILFLAAPLSYHGNHLYGFRLLQIWWFMSLDWIRRHTMWLKLTRNL